MITISLLFSVVALVSAKLNLSGQLMRDQVHSLEARKNAAVNVINGLAESTSPLQGGQLCIDETARVGKVSRRSIGCALFAKPTYPNRRFIDFAALFSQAPHCARRVGQSRLSIAPRSIEECVLGNGYFSDSYAVLGDLFIKNSLVLDPSDEGLVIASGGSLVIHHLLLHGSATIATLGELLIERVATATSSHIHLNIAAPSGKAVVLQGVSNVELSLFALEHQIPANVKRVQWQDVSSLPMREILLQGIGSASVSRNGF